MYEDSNLESGIMNNCYLLVLLVLSDSLSSNWLYAKLTTVVITNACHNYSS